MPTYNLTPAGWTSANICCSGTSEVQIWGPTEVYGCYLDDGDAGTFAMTAFRFSSVAMTGTDIVSATLALDRLPAAYGDSGTNGDAGLRFEDTAAAATYTTGATGRPYGRTYRTSQANYTFASGGDAASIDVTTQMQDLAAAYGVTNITAMSLAIAAQTIGWKASSVSYRAVCNDGTGTLPTLTIVTSSGTEVTKGVVCYSFASSLGAASAAASRASGVNQATDALLIGARAASAVGLGQTVTNPQLSQSANVSVSLAAAGNAIASLLAQGSAVATRALGGETAESVQASGAVAVTRAQTSNAVTSVNAIRGSATPPATYLVRTSTQLPTGGGYDPDAWFRDINSNRHGFKDNSSGGIGQLCHVVCVKQETAPNTSYLYGYTSWAADTWTPVQLSTWNYFWYVKCSVQGADGKLHVIYTDTNAGQVRYRRLTIGHGIDGKINGATQDVDMLVCALGLAECTLDMRECVAQDDSRWIVFSKVAESPTTLQMGKFPTTATSSSEVVGMGGGASLTTIETGINNQHDHGGLLAQFSSTRGIVCVWGYATAEESTEALKRVLLTPSGATTWSVGSTITETPADASIGMLCSANGAVYRAASGYQGSGRIYFDRYNSDGSVTTNIFPSISTQEWSAFACFEVSSDGTKAFMISSDYWSVLRIGHLENGTWTVTNGNLTDCFGLGGFGFGTGLCVLNQEGGPSNGTLYTLAVLEDPGAEPVMVQRGAACNSVASVLGSAAREEGRGGALGNIVTSLCSYGAPGAGRGYGDGSLSSLVARGLASVEVSLSAVGASVSSLLAGGSSLVEAFGIASGSAITSLTATGARAVARGANATVLTQLDANAAPSQAFGFLGQSLTGIDPRISAEAIRTSRANLVTSVNATSTVDVFRNAQGWMPGGTSSESAGSAAATRGVEAYAVSSLVLGGSMAASAGFEGLTITTALPSSAVGVGAAVAAAMPSPTQLGALGSSARLASLDALGLTSLGAGTSSIMGASLAGRFHGVSSLEAIPAAARDATVCATNVTVIGGHGASEVGRGAEFAYLTNSLSVTSMAEGGRFYPHRVTVSVDEYSRIWVQIS